MFRIHGSELLMRLPAQGSDPSLLARPLTELGPPPCGGVNTLRVEAPGDWRWGSLDAAFLARVLQALPGGAVFGALVALLGCFYGLRAERSASGVGSATTGAVVASIVGIIALDAVFALCANALDE